MYKIAFIVPYFGKFPKGFPFWLLSCGCNPSIDWLIFTDDRTKYDYPSNVKVTYCSFGDMKKKAQQKFDFPISLDRPYKLCDYRPAYGEIFAEELKNYDFWGHCDIDLVWGNIRKFYTDEILEKFEKVGFNGHCTLYRNVPTICARYKTTVKGRTGYREVFSNDKGFCFDEIGMDAIYDELGIEEIYKGIDFANLLKYDYGFYLDWKTADEAYKNKYQVFTWKKGCLIRHYLYQDTVYTEEYMYLHYWCRPTTFKVKEYNRNMLYLIYPDITTEFDGVITPDLIKRKSKRSKLRYYAKSIWFNRKKLTVERILFNLKGMFAYKKK